MLVNDTTGICIARSCHRRKTQLAPVPAEGMCVDTSWHPKGNKVSWHVVRLDNIMYIVIIRYPQRPSSTSQLASIALSANTVPRD